MSSSPALKAMAALHVKRAHLVGHQEEVVDSCWGFSQSGVTSGSHQRSRHQDQDGPGRTRTCNLEIASFKHVYPGIIWMTVFSLLHKQIILYEVSEHVSKQKRFYLIPTDAPRSLLPSRGRDVMNHTGGDKGEDSLLKALMVLHSVVHTRSDRWLCKE